MKIKVLTPKETIAEAARDAVSQIAAAQTAAETRLASAARDASRVVTTSAGERGEQWDDYRKLVMSELASLKADLREGFGRISDQFASHDGADALIFLRIDNDIKELDRKFAKIDARTDRQLWVVYGTALASLIAVLSRWWK